MNQFFYLPPATRSVVAALEKAGFSYYGVEEEWDESALTCCGWAIQVQYIWGYLYEDGANLLAIWAEEDGLTEVEEEIAIDSARALIESGVQSHFQSPGQLCLFEEAHK